MLDHLDDPDPPRPSELVVDRIVAEGARRLRHRRLAASGVLVVASTLAVVLAAAVLPDGEGGGHDKVEVIGPSGETTTTQDGPLSPGGTTTTTTPAGTDGTAMVAAVVARPEEGMAQVVLLDPTTGEVDRTLASYALDGQPPLCCIDISDDGTDIFYVEPGRPGDDESEDVIWHVDLGESEPPPAAIAGGTSPVISPDGTRLAFVHTHPDDGPSIVVRELASGETLDYPQGANATLHDVAWIDDATLAVTMRLPEGAPTAVALDVASGQFESLGPPADVPPGTGWQWVERGADGSLSVVQTCCSLGGPPEQATSLVRVDPATREVTPLSDLPGPPAGFATGPSDDRHLLVLQPEDGAGTGYGRLQVLVDGQVHAVPGDHRIIAADW